MWVLSASSECYQCIKSIIDGLEEMQQIKDNIVCMKKVQSTTVDWKHCSSDFKNTISPCEKKSVNLEWLRLNGLVTFIINVACQQNH